MEFEPGTTLPPATDDRIRWFETTYRIKLPVDYVSILKIGNGGVPVRKRFRLGKRERVVERMLCLLPRPNADEANGWYDLSVVISQLDARLINDENLVGMNVIPIAALFAGDYVCLDYRHTEHPTIAVWDHEKSEDLRPELENAFPSFSAFHSQLF